MHRSPAVADEERRARLLTPVLGFTLYPLPLYSPVGLAFAIECLRFGLHVQVGQAFFFVCVWQTFTFTHRIDLTGLSITFT